VTNIYSVQRFRSLSKRLAVRFNDGSVETFPVRDDIDLSQRKVGEKVVFMVTEMVALSVEKPWHLQLILLPI